MKRRKKIPAEVQRVLLLECGYKCSMNRCDREVSLEFHHIDSNPENNNLDNIIVLCSIHHDMAHNGKLDRKACKFLKSSLKEVGVCGGQIKRLSSRTSVFKEAIKRLTISDDLRATFVGPTFIRPDFIIDKRNALKATPDLDAYFFDYISQHKSRFIFRNNRRFVEKVSSLLNGPEEKEMYRVEMLRKIQELEHNKEYVNFKFCCVDTGFYRIDYIFDSAVLSCSREGYNSPISAGDIYEDPYEVRRVRENFDNIFDHCYRGKDVEYSALKSFIEKSF